MVNGYNCKKCKQGDIQIRICPRCRYWLQCRSKHELTFSKTDSHGPNNCAVYIPKGRRVSAVYISTGSKSIRTCVKSLLCVLCLITDQSALAGVGNVDIFRVIPGRRGIYLDGKKY